MRLRACVSALARRLRAQAGPEGLGSAKLGVLGHLYRLGTLTPTQLALHERVKVQTLTRLLAELEAEGCVIRRRNDKDARQSVLALTRVGVQRLTVEVHRREDSLAAVLQARLDRAERAQLLVACNLLDRLTTGWTDEAIPAVSADSSVRTP
ncbi:MAG TPA: MarR family transcriptional regulator [Caldimonas sp.]